MRNTDFPLAYLKNSETQIINYARYGRILKVNKWLVIFQVLISFSITLFLVLNIETLSHIFISYTARIMENATIKNIEISPSVKIFYIGYEGRYPESYESALYISALIVGILTLRRIKLIPEPIIIYLRFFMFTLLFSCLFFYFIPEEFPYDSNEFSTMYVLSQFIIMSLIPILLGISLAVFNVSTIIFLANLVIIGVVLIYSFFFGLVRYISFLLILHKLSYIWMANLFLFFGPLLDTVYIVGIYSLYISLISRITKVHTRYWRWLY